MKFISLRLYFPVFIFLLLVQSCKKDEDENLGPVKIDASQWGSFVPVSWYNMELKLLKETPGFTPPIAARAIGYTSITLHETVVRGMENGTSLSGQLEGLAYLPAHDGNVRYNWAIAANAAMADVIRSLFGNASQENLDMINALETENLLELSTTDFSQEEIDRSIEFGKLMANAIYLWGASDGGQGAYLNNFPTNYTPPKGPGLWIPTPPLYQSAMLPYWGKNRYLVKENGQVANQIAKAPSFSPNPGSAFYQSADAVYQKGNTLTPEETIIARYWADGPGTFTPPGHMIAITTQLIKDNNLSLDKAAQLFAKVGIALNDAGILCWQIKYRENLIRPVSYIQQYIDQNWMPLISTPPFPSYFSGHAAFTCATSTILANYFGDSFSFTDNQKIDDGFSPRSYQSFSSMTEEAAISRVYGGIHYQFDSEVGKSGGLAIANKVLALKF